MHQDTVSIVKEETYIEEMFQMWARQLQQMNAAKARAALGKRSQPQSNDTEEIVLDGDAVTSEVTDNQKFTPQNYYWQLSSNLR